MVLQRNKPVLIVCLAMAGLLAGWTVPLVAPAQTESERDNPNTTIRVQVPRVLVDVVVLDSDDQPVRTLRKEDFRLYEDGQQVEILEFTAVEVPADRERAAGEAPPAATAREGAVAAVRLVAIYFGPMRPQDRVLATEAARRYVQEIMSESDRVAVIHGTRLLQTFTNDKQALLAAIRLVEEKRPGEQPQPQRVVEETESEELVQLALSAGSDLPEDVPTGAGPRQTDLQRLPLAATASLPADMIEEFERGIQSTGGLEAQLFINKILRDLEGIISALRVFEGRKSLVVFASGFPVSRENKAYLDRAIERANEANVVVYNVNARGLEAISGLGSASESRPVQSVAGGGGGRVVAEAALGITTAKEYGNLLERRSGLQALSNQTGGRWYQTNDFSEVFGDVREDTQFYYLLSYRPPEFERDGKFHKIEVKLPNHSDYKVIARPGYSTWKEFEDFNKRDKRLYLQEALLRQREFRDFPLGVGVSYFQLADGNYYVPVTYEFPVGEVPRKEDGDEAEVKLEVYTAAAARGAAAPPIREALQVKSKAEHFDPDKAPVPTVEYFAHMVLAPGDYLLKFVAQDQFSGRTASVTKRLRLFAPADPEVLDTSGLILTDRLVPMSEEEAGEMTQSVTGGHPLLVNNVKVIVKGLARFVANQPVYTYYQVYGAAPHEKTGRPQLITKSRVLREGKVVRRLGAMPVYRYTDPDRRMAAVPATLNLRGLRPGTYLLEVEVRDDVTGRRTTMRHPFVIIPPRDSREVVRR